MNPRDQDLDNSGNEGNYSSVSVHGDRRAQCVTFQCSYVDGGTVGL